MDDVENRQNTRIAYNPSDAPPLIQSKNQTLVLFLSGAARDVKVMPSHSI